MKRELYKHLAGCVQAIRNCQESSNTEWAIKHNDTLKSLVNAYMPLGSGIDSGVSINLINSHPDKLVFTFEYHHMRDGYYTHWSSHTLTVTPSLVNDIDLKITKDGERDDFFMDYLYDTFQYALTSVVDDADILK